MRAARGAIAPGAASWLYSLRFPASSTAVKADVASGFGGVRRARTPPPPPRPQARRAVLVTGTSFGLPSLPFITAPVGEAHEYHPVPASDVMPVQEAGTKPARALPYQPNASLTGFTTANGTTTANLALGNSGHFAGRSAHFSVYDNTLPTTPSVASYPDGFPGQYTVAPTAHAVETVAAAGPVSPAGAYDITVIGPNRFLRRFTGNVKTAGATATVEANYFADGLEPLLTLTLANGGESALTFTVQANNYSHAPAQTYHVPAGKFLAHEIDPVRTASGWYDVTVTVSSDSSWSQRFTGHLENGRPSITG
jgi:phospholipase C